MAKDVEAAVLTDVLRYDIEKGERVKLRDCEIVSKFLFSHNDFYLVRKGGWYMICLPSKDSLILLTKEKVIADGVEVTAGEVTGRFRKEYLKNGITQERLDLFIKNPSEYLRKYNKTAGRK